MSSFLTITTDHLKQIYHGDLYFDTNEELICLLKIIPLKIEQQFIQGGSCFTLAPANGKKEINFAFTISGTSEVNLKQKIAEKFEEFYSIPDKIKSVIEAIPWNLDNDEHSINAELVNELYIPMALKLLTSSKIIKEEK